MPVRFHQIKDLFIGELYVRAPTFSGYYDERSFNEWECISGGSLSPDERVRADDMFVREILCVGGVFSLELSEEEET